MMHWHCTYYQCGVGLPACVLTVDGNQKGIIVMKFHVLQQTVSCEFFASHVNCPVTTPKVYVTRRPSAPLADVQDMPGDLLGSDHGRRPQQSALAHSRPQLVTLLLCHGRQHCLPGSSPLWWRRQPRICHPPYHPAKNLSVLSPAVPVAASQPSQPHPQGPLLVHLRHRPPETTGSAPSPSASVPTRPPGPTPRPRPTYPTGPGARLARACCRGPRLRLLF